MPGFDGTGPRGQGAMTGGGFGYCRPGAESAPLGRRRGLGLGRGRGRGLFGWGRRGFGLGSGGYGYGSAVSTGQEDLLRENAELRAKIESLEKKVGGQE